MKCCCSRPTCAITIGLLHSISNIGVAIFCTMNLIQLANCNVEEEGKLLGGVTAKTANATALAFSLVTVVLAITMIVGVVMKRYMLIVPYLVLSVIGTVLFVGIHVIVMGFLIAYEAPVAAMFDVIIKVILVTGLQILILYPIYTLYKEWRAEALFGTKGKIYGTAPIMYQNVYEAEKKQMDM